MIASAHRLHPTSSPFSWSYLCRPGETKTALDGLAQSGCSPGRSPGPADRIDRRRTRRIGSSGTGASGQRRHPGSRERSVISLSVEQRLGGCRAGFVVRSRLSSWQTSKRIYIGWCNNHINALILYYETRPLSNGPWGNVGISRDLTFCIYLYITEMLLRKKSRNVRNRYHGLKSVFG